MALSGGELLVELALVSIVAAAATLAFHRLRQPVVLGYLLGGVLIGPHGPLAGLQSQDSVSALADLGIVFLMFAIGLEFRLRRLARAGMAAMGSALLGIAAVGLAGWAASRALGMPGGDAVVLGALLAISSTVLAAKAIFEVRAQGQRWADLAMAILIAQDLAAVAILAVLGSAGSGGVTPLAVLGVLGRLATFAAAALVGGLLVVPRLVNRLAREGADEVLVLTLVALALGTAVLALALGFSIALGAFLIGAVVAEASEAWVAEQRVLPLRDLFTAVFFVGIGMQLDPALLAAAWKPALALAAVMVALKVAVHAGAGFALGAPPRDAFKASLAVAQVGEFSFVIAGLGLALGVVRQDVLAITVAVAIGSALWTPYLVRSGDALYARLAPHVPAGPARALRGYAAWLAARRQRGPADPEARAHRSEAAWNALAVALILVATSSASGAVIEQVTVRGLTDRALVVLPWLAGGVLALPFGFNAARALHALAGRRRLSPVRGAALLLATALAVSLAFLVLAPLARASLPPLPLVLLGLAAFLGASAVLWESTALLHRRVEQAVTRAMGGEALGEEHRAVLDALRTEYRLGSEADTARVRPGTAASGSTLRGLGLRARTGATLLAVQRAGRTLVNPAADFVLQPGDALLLLGSPEQLERARAALLAPAGAPPPDEVPEPALEELPLDAASPLAGRTLAEGHLRERSGVTVLGVERGGQRVPNPGAQFHLQPGDALLVMGSPEQLRRARGLAGPPGEGDAARGEAWGNPSD